MPYLNPFLKLVVQGSLGSVEVFSYSLHLIGSANPAPATVPQAVVDAVAAFHGSALVGSTAIVRTIKLNLIGENGKYVSDTTVQEDLESPYIAGQGPNQYPMQVALAMSLLATKERGKASKGRFYLPMPGTLLEGPNWTMPLATAQIYLEALQTFVEDLNDAVGSWRVGLVSNVGIGAESVVTRVRVGHALDTIRSRRNKVPEAYTEGPIAPLP